MKMKKRIICSVLALSISMGGIAFADPNTQNTDISALRQQLEENNGKKNGLQSEMEALDNQLTVATNELISLQDEYDRVQSEIESIEKELELAEKKYNERNATLNSRVEAMYKSGNVGYVEVILSSRSMGDFFTRVDMIKNVVGHDQAVIKELKTEKETIDSKKIELDAKLTQAKGAKTRSEAKKNELVEAAQAKEALARELDSQNENLSAQINDLEAQARRAAEEAAARAAAEQAQVVSRENSSRQESANNTGIAAPSAPVQAPAQSVPAAPSTPAPAAPSQSAPAAPSAPAPAAPSASSSSAVISKAYAYLGVPYVWGGSSPSGFDCSGLTSYVFRQVGVSLPRTAAAQQKFGTKVSLSALQPGDLVFWGSPAYHVGIYIGGGSYIHAPTTGDVVRVATLKGATSATRVLR
jgi:peptidoglycan DL-endopeptidase CwlO